MSPVCRMVALSARSDPNIRFWLRALAEAASNDPFLQKLSRHDASHGDGWGLAALSRERLLHYRSAVPIWMDSALETLAGLLAAPVVLLAHARKASRGTPLGVGAAHPFPLDTRDGGVLFVAQNGGVAVDKLASMIKGAPLLDNVDSFVYSVALAEKLEGASLGEALAELHKELEEREAVEGMANTFALLLKREQGAWKAELGVVRHIARESLREYGEVFVTSGQDVFAAVSSTLALKLQLKTEPVRENSVILYDVESGRLTRLPL